MAIPRKVQEMLLFGVIIAVALGAIIILVIRDKGEPPRTPNETATSTGKTTTTPKTATSTVPKRRTVLSLQITTDKKEYKLGEPIIVRATLHKNGAAATLLEMREWVNIHAKGHLLHKGIAKSEKLFPPIGAFVAKKHQKDAVSQDTIKKYQKLYPKAAKINAKGPFPTKDNYFKLPENKFSVKKEIHLEKLLMITKPGKVSFQLMYNNNVGYYLLDGRRVKIDAWKGSISSNMLSIEIKDK